MRWQVAGRLIYLLFLLSSTILAADDKNNVQAKENSPSPAKTYSEEEFKKAVALELELQQKKLGKDKLADFSRQLLLKEEKIKMDQLELVKEREKLALSIQDFEKKLKEFKERQDKLISCIDKQEEEKNKRVNHMVEVISVMRPNNAADLLATQDPEISVQILGLLDAATVSKIFNLMDKEISARLQKQYMTMKK